MCGLIDQKLTKFYQLVRQLGDLIRSVCWQLFVNSVVILDIGARHSFLLLAAAT